jgi:hypothetical protein
MIVAAISIFQNCGVSDESGALSLGSSRQNNFDDDEGETTGGTTSSTTGGSSTSGTTTTGSTTGCVPCAAASTVACDQPYSDSCGNSCGVGTNNCAIRCSSVASDCLAGGNRFRQNVPGEGCGAGYACLPNGQLDGTSCSDCACLPCRP